VSRYLVIALALIAAGVKFGQGAWVEAAGLTGLAGGLAALRFGGGTTVAKAVAAASFIVTGLAVGILAIRYWAT
jgi:hypothetical protein